MRKPLRSLFKGRRPYAWLPMLIVVMTLAAVAIGLVTLHYVETRLVAMTGESLALGAAEIADKLDRLLIERHGDVHMLARAFSLQARDRAYMTRYLLWMRENYPVYVWLGATDAQGVVVAATDQAYLGQDISKSEWFQAARVMGAVHVGDVEPYEAAGGVDAVAFTAPITGPRGEFLGVVTTLIGLPALEDVLTRTIRAVQSRQGFLGNVEYQFLTHEGVAFIDFDLQHKGNVNLKSLGLPSALLTESDRPGYVEEEHLRRHVPVVTGYAHTQGHGEFQGLQWGILLRLDREDILAPIWEVLIKLGVAGLVVWGPMFVLLLWATGRVRKEWAQAQLESERARAAEATLREQNERFELVSRATNDWIWDLNVVTNEIWWNDSIEELFGYAAQDVRPTFEFWYERIHPDERERVIASQFAVLEAGGRFWSGEYRFRRADGTYAEVIDQAHALYDEQGKAVRMIGSVRDVTERKQAEETLRSSEERFRSAFAETAVGMVLLDINGRFLRANRAFCTLVGYSEDELFTKTFLEITHPEDLEKNLKVVKQLMAGEIGSFFVEKRYLHKQGHPIWVHASVASVRDALGKPLNFIAQSQDIAERKQAENRQAAQLAISLILAESDTLAEAAPQLLQAVCDTVGWELGAIWRVDRMANVLRCENIWHLPSVHVEEFMTLSRTITFSPGIGLPGRVWASGAPAWIPDVVKDPNFPRAPIAAKSGLHGAFGFPVKSGETVSGVVEFFSHEIRQPDESLLQMMADIGIKIGQFVEHKQLEEQLRQSQKMEAIGQLAGGVAHDFNNMLTIIKGYSQLLLSRIGADDPLRHDVQEIQKAGDRASGLTMQLLAFSRRQVLSPTVLNLSEVVGMVEGMLRRLIGEDIELVAAPDPALGLVKADPGQVEQVIINLVVNARDAMPQGGRLSIQTANVEVDETLAHQQIIVKPGSYVMLAVSDTGCGMDATTQARIFEPFFTTKAKGKGTGLGLAMVYGIVKQSGGYVFVYSELGRGTTFKIYLPRVAEESGAAEPAHVPVASSRGSETVLLVEDEETIRLLASRVLRLHGYTVLAARDADEALRVSQECHEPIHLLLTDVVMPGGNGRELAERLAPVRPGMRVLYTSGYTDDINVHHGVSQAGAAFLQKPFTPNDLARKVREVLDREWIGKTCG